MSKLTRGSANRTMLRRRARKWFGTLNYARRHGGMALRGYRAISVTRRLGASMIKSLHKSAVPGVNEAGWVTLPAGATAEEYDAFIANICENTPPAPPRVSVPRPFWRAWLRATNVR